MKEGFNGIIEKEQLLLKVVENFIRGENLFEMYDVLSIDNVIYGKFMLGDDLNKYFLK